MWPRLINTAVGIWLMAAPAVLGYEESAAEINDRIVGPLVVTFAFVAIWDVIRPLRKINFMLGVWLLAAPAVLQYSFVNILNSFICGILIIIFSSVKGRQKHMYDGGWSMVWEKGGHKQRS